MSVTVVGGVCDKNKRVYLTSAKIKCGERTLNDLHRKFTATGNNNLLDQFKIDVLGTTAIHWEKIASFARDHHDNS